LIASSLQVTETSVRTVAHWSGGGASYC
jgi:hypothetical protein